MAAGIAATLVGSLLPTLPMAAVAAAEPYKKPPVVSSEKPVKGHDTKPRAPKADTTVSKVDGKHGTLPGKGSATVDVPGERGKAVKAGKLPVSITSSGAVGQAQVEVLGQEAAAKAGVSGVLFTVTGVSDSSGVSVDYSSFAQAAGSGFGSRLKLVRLPDCALTTPELAECRSQTPLPGGNDTEAQTLKADALTAAPVGSTRIEAAEGVVVLAATAGTAGPSGDYKATPLASASSWSTSLNSGSFDWSYSMPLTPMPGGLTPGIGLSYDSGAVDGRTANSNNQASWAGDGFDLSPGFVERSYKPCADDGAPKTGTVSPGDQCWGTDNATISFAGHSGELIPVSADEWRLKGDDNTKVVRIRDGARGNGDNNGEYFKATTTDGTSYYFGYNRLPNWTSGQPETKSVYTVPVFGNNAGEPCNGATFDTSWCQQGWRWNLDLVVDTHGNDITYWYTPETNNYSRNLKTANRTPYVRGGHLDHIEYGQQKNDIYSSTVKPMARVDFGTAERCLETTASLCDAASIDTNRQYWYDTPWDQNCKDGTDCTTQFSPTFFTRTRLVQVVAKTLQANGTYQAVDTWDLTHKWGTADYDYQLLLDSIKHTGNAATPAVSLPATTLSYRQMANRLDRTGDGRAPFIKQRLGTVTDELGGQIDVNYSAAPCDWAALPTPQSNTTRCFPQMYQASDTSPVTTEWFNKYVVDSITAGDKSGHAPDMVTRYTYLGDAAWHFDDEDGLTKDKLKTWSQWRGYAHVRVQTGSNAAMSTQTDHFFLRGMDGDRNNPADKNSKRTVTVNDGQGTTLTDDNAWAGFAYRTEQYDKPGGLVLSKTVSAPWKKQTAQRVRDWGTTTANMTGVSSTRTFTSLDKGAGASWRETRTNTTFDDYGRATTVDSLGDVSLPDDDKCTRTTYLDNTAAWFLTGTSRVETVAANCSTSVDRTTKADGTSAVLSDTRFRFDGQAYGVAPTKGDLTLSHVLKSTTGSNATYLDSATSYDAYGRVLAATTLVSSTVFDLTGANSPATTALSNPRTTTTAYTPATGRPTRAVVTSPPVTAGDAATKQTVTTDYDLLRGQVTDTLDADNRRTDVIYDALGRTQKVWLPDRSKANSQSPDQEYAYTVSNGQIASVASKTLNEDGSQQTSYTLYDSFGRTRQTQTPGPGGGRILSDTFYDERGQAYLAYAPYYAAGAPSATLRNVDDTTGVETQIQQEFDGLGRVVKSTTLAGNGAGTPLSTTLTEYNGDRVTVTPPTGGTPTTTVTDAAGHITELRQYRSATPTGAYDSTTYAYDPAGNRTKLTDPSGTVWTWVYDQHNLLRKAVDPDSGTSTRTYDDLSRLVSTTDGRGKTVARVYDNADRLLETRDGSATGPLLTSQSWDPVGNKGQLSSSSSYYTIGATTYEYKTAYSLFDTMGRPTRSTVTIPSVPGQEALAGSYISGTTYRLDGQAKTVSYPAAGNLAAETVSYTYNDLHQLLTVSGYQTEQLYSLTGKPTQSTFSNGTAGKQVIVTNAYEFGTQRLASSRTDQAGIADPVRAAAYTYDQVGNVTSVTDTSRSGTDRQCFSYDYLARLTEAYTPNTGSCTAPSGTQLGGPAPYWTSWTYNTNGTRATETRHDTTGNTGQDATTTYTYPTPTTAHPHALTSTSTVTGALGAPVVESYDYNANGATTGRHLKPAGNKTTDQTLTWNSEGDLSQISATVKSVNGSTTTTTNQTTDYLYDADGNRLITHTLDTADPAAENWTLHLGSTELNLVKGAAKATATRYYALSGATAVRTDDNSLTFQTADHHGTAETNIDATTGAVQQRRTLPFGTPRGTKPTTWAGTRGFLGGTNEPTGLTHLGARDYDTTTGRFISVDPFFIATNTQPLASYTYSGNNPLTLSDPSGLMYPACGASCDTTPYIGPAPAAHCATNSCATETGTHEYVEGEKNARNTTSQDLRNAKSSKKSRPGFLDGVGHVFGGMVDSVKQMGSDIKGCVWDHVGRSCGETIEAFDPVSRVEGIVSQGVQIGKDVANGDYAYALGELTALGASSLAKNGAGRIKDKALDKLAESSGLGGKIFGNSDFAERLQLPGCLTGKNSFPAGTRVLLADGSTKEIEHLDNGDLVLATDPTTGTTQAEPVSATIVTADDSEFTDLTVLSSSGPQKITSTAHHPFWDATDSRWVDAQDVQIGHQFLGGDGEKYTVEAATTRHTEPRAAYNLTIRGLHTYYVLAGATPVLVHNSGGDGLTPAEQQISQQAQSIYRSPEFATLRGAHAAGEYAQISVNGVTVVYEPGLPSSGFTLFGEHGFAMGPEAFSSEAETGKTVLHEMHRLSTSQAASGVSAELASGETQSAFDFANKAYSTWGCG
ncbi:type IV secretion protein Rhs [Kitasatospora phosalacinea]|uniref:Type IV secretion protein Rhs n=1 Tax=Kitasatospora phosalacinea TaxID=2065 RepID=A0A9W6Q875_9ACTN|nr:polymorphic toxin-type HINT domain-containing protein [Kitasatospora phosalacinea]GLW72105.1 type IV secretion protein Rhs [Kitasatospora phosalacinea]